MKHTSTTKPQPLHTIRIGEVAIVITERQTNAGFKYKVMTPTREWTNKSTGRVAQGSPFFFEEHEESLVTGIRRAAAWLRESHATPKTADADKIPENSERNHEMHRE
jgi:hypothetical protein